MNNTKNSKLTTNSKTLRKNMTKEEKHLWYDFLKNLPITVHRQKVINRYIVDFYIANNKTVIEIDGSQHYEDSAVEYDKKRDEFLNSIGIRVLRYTNIQINKEFENVCDDILRNIDKKA